MPIETLDLTPPEKVLDYDTQAWLIENFAALKEYLDALGSGGGAPASADYLVRTANAGLSAELVVTDTATVTWDFSTPGQAKANASGSGGISMVEAMIYGLGS